MRIGLLPLGRPTFDVAFAEDRLAAMLARLDGTGHDLLGPRGLLFDADATRAALAELKGAGIDRLLILQTTFTDAAMTIEAANAFDCPLALWAVPEPRLGGRLRLNAFCGLNLASHALGLAQRDFCWLYADPEKVESEDLATLLTGMPESAIGPSHQKPEPTDHGRNIAAALDGRRIGRIGEHPDGFDTCAYDPARLNALTGIEVEAMELDRLFVRARNVPNDSVASIRATVDDLVGVEAVDQQELDRSLRLKSALDGMRSEGAFDAFAIRCWPETFTEYGGAVCGPVSMLGEARVPCACEADVYGAATQLLMQAAAEAPVFLVDLVDMDAEDDTGVVWHCGQAPISMADPDDAPEATIHTNRKMPLLYQFALKPGRVTLARISQARGQHTLVLATGEMQKRPIAFTGTSGVIRFDRPADAVLQDVILTRLEHHMGLVYGDHAEALAEAAAAMDVPVVRL